MNLPQGLTDEQIAACVWAVKEWLQVLYREGRYPPSEPDALHSALLHRLLSGKEPLPLPPPKAFSYPNYMLADTGRCLPLEVVDYGARLTIDQGREWNVVHRESDGAFVQYVVVWKDQPTRYRLQWVPQSREIPTCAGTQGKWRRETLDGWVLERLEETEGVGVVPVNPSGEKPTHMGRRKSRQLPGEGK